MGNLENRRKNFYIKKRFQSTFILKFCALVVLGSLISSITIYLMSKATVTTTFENSRLVIKTTADFILPAVLVSSTVVILLIGLAAIAITLFTSHKIAGPLYRLEKDVNEITLGNLRMVFNLRQGDEIKPLAVSLNAMAQSLKGRLTRIKSLLKELDAAIGSSPNISSDITVKIKKVMEEIEKFNL